VLEHDSEARTNKGSKSYLSWQYW